MILLYSRCSTDEQEKSLKEQERKLRAFARMQGAEQFDVVYYEDKGISGAMPLSQRPAGGKLLNEITEKDTVVAIKVDRIFRSASDALVTAEGFAARKINLILLDMGIESVTQSGISKMFFSLLAAFAEFERGRIAERMADGRKAKKERNGRIGGVPYGFKAVGRGKDSLLEPIPEEIEMLKQIAIWKRHWAPATIRRKLDNAGYKPRSGKEWDLSQVRRLMNSAPELLQRVGIQ